ncbi:hypothetical protein BZA05DRAFT_447704 [Tricharina praecox]|uniref:uncharacterized protein n=1 Tax=Tricharina praecox TaxID=43433 RepID=UPI00221F14C3|nr:uncharacterized protein BZA05DRAFT_447704 [Tricharina praecox]KAI5845956.1 hypothetical protein BZA05DRAFT_447704 [Tricharina praecox]
MCPHPVYKFACDHVVASAMALWCVPAITARRGDLPLASAPGVVLEKEVTTVSRQCSKCLQHQVDQLRLSIAPRRRARGNIQELMDTIASYTDEINENTKLGC